MALNIIIRHVATVDITDRYFATKAAIKLIKAAYMKGRKHGHTKILYYFNSITDNLDNCIPETFLAGSLSDHTSERDL